MKNVLITGGAGFLGSHLCEYYLLKNYKVICVDNFLTGSPRNIESFKDNNNFLFLEHDVCQTLNYSDPVDLVLHFASPASPFDYIRFPIQTLKVGALGTHNMLGFAKAKRARFLLASTSEVYGDPQVHPQTEDYWGHVNPIGPRGVYDEAKRFAEAITLAYHRMHQLDTKIVRIFNTYGPRMQPNDGRAIPAFISSALNGENIPVFGDGSQTRSFCFITDLVRGIFDLAQTDYHNPVNIGNPKEMTVLQLGEKIIELTKSKSKVDFKDLPEDDPKIRQPNIDRAKELLSWEPEVKLEDGLKETIKYFQQLKEEQGVLEWKK